MGSAAFGGVGDFLVNDKSKAPKKSFFASGMIGGGFDLMDEVVDSLFSVGFRELCFSSADLSSVEAHIDFGLGVEGGDANMMELACFRAKELGEID